LSGVVLVAALGACAAPAQRRASVRPDAPARLTPEPAAVRVAEAADGPIELEGLVLDFGSGIAPYDDARPSLEPLPADPRGFSDSVLQMAYRGPLWGGARWFGGVATLRYQDEPIRRALLEPDLAWVMVGIHFEF
jgi:hypothetical protein